MTEHRFVVTLFSEGAFNGEVFQRAMSELGEAFAADRSSVRMVRNVWFTPLSALPDDVPAELAGPSIFQGFTTSEGYRPNFEGHIEKYLEMRNELSAMLASHFGGAASTPAISAGPAAAGVQWFIGETFDSLPGYVNNGPTSAAGVRRELAKIKNLELREKEVLRRELEASETARALDARKAEMVQLESDRARLRRELAERDQRIEMMKKKRGRVGRALDALRGKK